MYVLTGDAAEHVVHQVEVPSSVDGIVCRAQSTSGTRSC